MLYYFYQMMINDISFMRVFRYITVRASIAFMLGFLFLLIAGKPFIAFLRKKKMGEEVRELGPQSHFSKKGTPTMGGVLIVGGIAFAMLLAGNWNNKFTIALAIITVAFALIGFLDDYLKWSKKNKDGLSPKMKMAGQLIIGVAIAFFIYKIPLIKGDLNFSLVNPFIKNSYIYLGFAAYLAFVIVVITGTSNAVNITDGLDGLVIGPVVIVTFILGVISYLTGHVELSNYLNLSYIDGAGEIAVFLSAVVGAGLGFLWYNFFPAQIFMGDTGSLTLGGIIGAVAIFLKQELLLPVIGFVFVIEALSVIIQVSSYKTRKKRVFKMAPIHHHFELEGLAETKVTMRFWIITIIAGIIGLIILKLR